MFNEDMSAAEKQDLERENKLLREENLKLKKSIKDYVEGVITGPRLSSKSEERDHNSIQEKSESSQRL